MKMFCPNCECDREATLYAEVWECKVCGEDFEVVCGTEPSNSNVSVKKDVLTDVKTQQTIESEDNPDYHNPDYYKGV